LLTVRARGRAELSRALEARGFEGPTVAQALDRLVAEGWLDDLAAARAAVRSRAGRFGRIRMDRELSSRGFSAETIARALAETGRAEEDAALAGVWKKLWKLHARLPREKRRRRVLSALLRRGFAADKVSEIMKGSDEVDRSSGEIP
jgi:regulatory protein